MFMIAAKIYQIPSFITGANNQKKKENRKQKTPYYKKNKNIFAESEDIITLV